jgi:hypothetical protein
MMRAHGVSFVSVRHVPFSEHQALISRSKLVFAWNRICTTAGFTDASSHNRSSWLIDLMFDTPSWRAKPASTAVSIALTQSNNSQHAAGKQVGENHPSALLQLDINLNSIKSSVRVSLACQQSISEFNSFFRQDCSSAYRQAFMVSLCVAYGE